MSGSRLSRRALLLLKTSNNNNNNNNGISIHHHHHHNHLSTLNSFNRNKLNLDYSTTTTTNGCCDRKQHLSSKTAISNVQSAKEWTKILTKAEKVVGYPTSFLNLRYLVSDEVAHFANLLRKLMHTKHPLIKMARRLIMNSGSSDSDTAAAKRSWQINGLVVLLVSKAAGIPRNRINNNNALSSSAGVSNTNSSSIHLFESEIADGIHQSQRRLAEIAEMIYMGSAIHKGVLDLKQLGKASSNHYKDMEQGNKLAVLCGDYLLANACTNLSKLQNNEVVDIMSQVIADISQGIFEHDFKAVAKFSFLKLWYDRQNSDSSSLLSNSVKSALLLVKHTPLIQELGFSFAKHLDISYKLWQELSDFKKESSSSSSVLLLKNPASIFNALYLDNLQQPGLKQQKAAAAAASVANDDHQVTTAAVNCAYYSSSSSSSNSFSSPSSSSLIESDLKEKLIVECQSLFENHLNLAIESLNLLENEHSEREAIHSLRSILNLMKTTI